MLDRGSFRTVVFRRGRYRAPNLEVRGVYERYFKFNRRRDYIFFAGSLVDQFDWQFSFDFLKQIPENIAIVIAGDGPFFSALKSMFSIMENVTLLGRIPADHVRILSEGSLFNFCFYSGVEFQGHLTNKVLEFAESSSPFVHNLGSFSINDDSFELGLSLSHLVNFSTLSESLASIDFSAQVTNFREIADRDLSIEFL